MHTCNNTRDDRKAIFILQNYVNFTICTTNFYIKFLRRFKAVRFIHMSTVLIIDFSIYLFLCDKISTSIIQVRFVGTFIIALCICIKYIYEAFVFFGVQRYTRINYLYILIFVFHEFPIQYNKLYNHKLHTDEEKKCILQQS